MTEELPNYKILKKKINRKFYLSNFKCNRIKLFKNIVHLYAEEEIASDYSLLRATRGDSPFKYQWDLVKKKLSTDGYARKNTNQRLFWTFNTVYLVKKYFTLGCQTPKNNTYHVFVTGNASLDIFVYKKRPSIYQDSYFPFTDEKSFVKIQLKTNSKYFIPNNFCYILIANQTCMFQLYSVEANQLKEDEFINIIDEVRRIASSIKENNIVYISIPDTSSNDSPICKNSNELLNNIPNTSAVIPNNSVNICTDSAIIPNNSAIIPNNSSNNICTDSAMFPNNSSNNICTDSAMFPNNSANNICTDSALFPNNSATIPNNSATIHSAVYKNNNLAKNICTDSAVYKNNNLAKKTIPTDSAVYNTNNLAIRTDSSIYKNNIEYRNNSVTNNNLASFDNRSKSQDMFLFRKNDHRISFTSQNVPQSNTAPLEMQFHPSSFSANQQIAYLGDTLQNNVEDISNESAEFLINQYESNNEYFSETIIP